MQINRRAGEHGAAAEQGGTETTITTALASVIGKLADEVGDNGNVTIQYFPADSEDCWHVTVEDHNTGIDSTVYLVSDEDGEVLAEEKRS
jgi:hypothetical protein